MLQYTLKRIIIIIIMATLLIASGVRVYAYWVEGLKTPPPLSTSIEITVGEFTLNTHPNFDPQEDYDVDDTFIYDNRVWIITNSWFNGSNFLNPDGTVNTTYVKPYGPIQEVTDEWRSYNTYSQNDIVLHNGYQWIVRHEGANSVEPGSNTNAWNRLGSDWFIYNTYSAGSIVTYNGQNWVSLTENRGRVPGQVPWAWQLQ